jgi:hypothetical protein
MLVSRRSTAAVLLVALLLPYASGCATYRASPTGTGGAAPTVAGKRTVWNLAWGLVSTPAAYVDNCHDQPLAEVTVKSNLAFSILTVVTLGLVAPAVVEWKCGKCPTEGTLGLAGDEVDDHGH